jgi:hypothetical protein
MNTQFQWKRVFVIVFGVLLWAAIFALVELCVGIFSVWSLRRSTSPDLFGVVTFFCCFAAFPLSGFVATFIVRLFDDAW